MAEATLVHIDNVTVTLTGPPPTYTMAGATIWTATVSSASGTTVTTPFATITGFTATYVETGGSTQIIGVVTGGSILLSGDAKAASLIVVGY